MIADIKRPGRGPQLRFRPGGRAFAPTPEGLIVRVARLGLDERARVTDPTREVLEIAIEGACAPR